MGTSDPSLMRETRSGWGQRLANRAKLVDESGESLHDAHALFVRDLAPHSLQGLSFNIVHDEVSEIAFFIIVSKAGYGNGGVRGDEWGRLGLETGPGEMDPLDYETRSESKDISS